MADRLRDDDRYRLPAPAGARSPRNPPSRSYPWLREDDPEEVRHQQQLAEEKRKIVEKAYELEMLGAEPPGFARSTEEWATSVLNRSSTPPPSSPPAREHVFPSPPSRDPEVVERQRKISALKRKLHQDDLERSLIDYHGSLPLWYRRRDEMSTPPLPAWCVEDSDLSSSEESSSDEDEDLEAPNVAAPATTPRTSPARTEASTQTPNRPEVGPDQGQSRHSRDQSQQTGFRDAATQTDPEEGQEHGQPHQRLFTLKKPDCVLKKY